jgi:hypothetical protein
MNEKADMQNDIVHLDVDIVMTDVPDTVTQEVEDFQAMAEMVKSGFPLPPKAVIMASPLSNKEQILKMMDEQPPQIPPELQKQIEEIQEQAKKLAEENQKLKLDQTNEQQKLQLQRAEAEAELELQRVKQEGEAALARAKAEADFALKKFVAEQELELAQMKCDGEKRIADQKMDLEERKASSAMVPPEVVEQYNNNKFVDSHGQKLMEKATEKQVEAIQGITGQLQDVAMQLQALGEQKPSITGAKAVRNGDGTMRAVQITKSDGSVEEISTMLQ